MKEESRFLASRTEKSETFLNKKLAEVVPEKLQDTLDGAFAKAFGLIFDKGTAVIEKTYRKEDMEMQFQINDYAENVRRDTKSLKVFSKEAKKSGTKNWMAAGAASIGMGILGIGLPDIPVFIGMVLKSVYEIALSYGFTYDTMEEQYFILLLIEASVSYGDEMLCRDEELNSFIETECMPVPYRREVQIQLTSASLSKELLYMKFLQGIPLIGAVGGAFDVVYMKQITEYANLKYKRRFLQKKRKK